MPRLMVILVTIQISNDIQGSSSPSARSAFHPARYKEQRQFFQKQDPSTCRDYARQEIASAGMTFPFEDLCRERKKLVKKHNLLLQTKV